MTFASLIEYFIALMIIVKKNNVYSIESIPNINGPIFMGILSGVNKLALHAQPIATAIKTNVSLILLAKVNKVKNIIDITKSI